MSNGITGIDHVLVGVEDLEAARTAYARLGFTLTPRGRHVGWGTANYCIMFEDDYVELLGIVDGSRFTNNLDRFLEERGEGLLGLALGTKDAAAVHAALTAAGIAAEPPRNLGRLLELPEGTVEPRFQLVHLPVDTVPAVPAFVCRHLTPELVRRPAWLGHANGARRIASLTARVDDVTTAASKARALLGDDAVSGDGDGLRLRLGNAVFHLIADGGRAGLAAIAMEVGDRAATAACLDRNGVSWRDDGGALRIHEEDARGVALSFVGAPHQFTHGGN